MTIRISGEGGTFPPGLAIVVVMGSGLAFGDPE